MLPHFNNQHCSFSSLISSGKSSEHSQSNDTFMHSRIYERNIWTHDYVESLHCDIKENTYSRDFDKLKKTIKDTLHDESVAIYTKLVLIDDLQRLGVQNHFAKEIKRSLDILFTYKEGLVVQDLQSTSLYFRLLRQHGYMVSQDMFKRFTYEDGSFRIELSEDVKGMMDLYEASHLCLEGEEILHEAKDFTLTHLKVLRENIDPNLAEEVTHALDLPFHWRMPRLEVRHYIDVYQRKENMDPLLLELAKVDFNVLQATHQKELQNMSRWWKELGLSDKLGTRDRLVESFLYSVGLTSQPHDRCCREWLTKVICLILTIDDIYDIIGSLDELEIFTTAVERWDIEVMELLPEYMKICFSALLNTTEDLIYNNKYKEDGFYILPSLKKAWAEFCNAMLVEAKWSEIGYIPSPSEYLQNAWVSSSVTVGLIHSFFATNQTIRNSVIEHLENNPDVIYYSAMIFRLCNDLATSSMELARGDVSSAIQCYMYEGNTSEQTARDKIKGLISDLWKKLNESIYDSPFEHSFVTITINNARTAHSTYQHGDGIGVQDNEARKRVARLLMEPISIKMSESS